MQSVAVFQATTVLLSDWPAEKVDALFFHGRSHGDDDGLFELVAELVTGGMVGHVALNGSDGERLGDSRPGVAWPGKQIYMDRLAAFGIGKAIVCSRPAFHNKDENEAFLEFAMARGWRTGIVLTQPHQLLRTFLGMVKSMAVHGYWMRAYAVAPKSTAWWKDVFGSQGAESKRRFLHIEEEFKRVPLYQQKGDLATFDELFEYLKRRSEIA